MGHLNQNTNNSIVRIVAMFNNSTDSVFPEKNPMKTMLVLCNTTPANATLNLYSNPVEDSASSCITEFYFTKPLDSPISKNNKKRMENYVSKTALGKQLREIRARIVSSGEPLLNWDDLEIEIAERRGGTQRKIR